MNWAIIMAGGFGERFWPMSRRSRPKQLLAIVSQRTMIQDAVDRLRPLVPPSRTVVVTNAVQAREVRKQLPRVQQIIAEPVGRNTAPCIALATAMIARRDPQAVMAVVPADSWIGDVERYRRVVADSLALAGQQDALIAIGIQPTSPHTGYGYIQVGEALGSQPSASGTRFWKAQRFVEKPDRPTAEQFLASGNYRWNAGMFVWSARAIGHAFEKFQPAMAASCARLAATKLRNFTREYRRLDKISVDYAIMEKADNVVVAHGDFPWDDVGDWPAIARHNPQDADGNVARAEFVGLDAANCVIVGDRRHLVAAVGVRDLVIVQTAAATLVCHKNEAQKVRALVKKLGEQKKYQTLL